MRSLTLTLLMGAVAICDAADISGEWIAEMGGAADPQYAPGARARAGRPQGPRHKEDR